MRQGWDWERGGGRRWCQAQPRFPREEHDVAPRLAWPEAQHEKRRSAQGTTHRGHYEGPCSSTEEEAVPSGCQCRLPARYTPRPLSDAVQLRIAQPENRTRPICKRISRVRGNTGGCCS